MKSLTHLAWVFFCLYYEDTGVEDMQEISVERGIQIPAQRVVFSYPYGEMEVGDSFVVPVVVRGKTLQNVLNANYRASKRLGWKFMARTEGEQIRVWRTA